MYKLYNPFVGDYVEKWFFECKNYSSGVPVEKLVSKFAWADVEKPDHLVFVMASYPTNDCRDWLKKKQETVSYKIHVIEGKDLKLIILLYNDLYSLRGKTGISSREKSAKKCNFSSLISIIERYFVNRIERLLRNSFIDWVATGLFPDPSRLLMLSEKIDLQRISNEELALLLSAFCTKISEINSWEGEHRQNVIDFSPFIQMGYAVAKTVNNSILENIEIQMNGRLIKTARSTKTMPKVQSSSVPVIYMKDGKKYEGHYTTLRQSQDLWIEILLGRIPTTEEIDITMQLFQPDGKRLVYANDVDLADLDKLSQKGVKAIDQGFMCVEVDMSNYKKSQ